MTSLKRDTGQSSKCRWHGERRCTRCFTRTSKGRKTLNEWTVVTVIITLVGLVGVFVKAAWSMSKSSQRLSDSVDRLQSSIDDLKTDNKEFRDKLENHETRISLLEHSGEN